LQAVSGRAVHKLLVSRRKYLLLNIIGNSLYRNNEMNIVEEEVEEEVGAVDGEEEKEVEVE
jgi:hypothetical protein